MTADTLHILKTVYGYDTFRGRQADIIRHVVAGNDAFFDADGPSDRSDLCQ
ncbi:hypothetical protein O8B93_06385 [Agrobacterium rhizogenes]|uniref:hypothetical protein n=1 Tax=Rhizobium rhizogenes TaxID=359 RepID=UPI0022B6916A|nr:hypothetical protein [Rhizobium rhizogenes]MCZ7447221.1 hypothetical protein [Rhizobium rhizogenes]